MSTTNSSQSPSRVVLGVDSSTQSTKVEARDLATGEVIGSGSAKHPPTTPPVSEQDPAAWWSALVDAISQLSDDVRERVAAISVAGQQHGLVLLDADGNAVRPAKLWNDTTSATQADELVEAFGRDEIASMTGSVPGASFTITKLAWTLANEPDALRRTERVMLPHDYLTWRLSGAHVTDRGDASGTGWFDPAGGTYSTLMLERCALDGIDWSERLPKVLDPGEPAGQIDADIARDLGLPESALVGPGTGDNMAGSLGLGLQPGDAVMSLGTSGVAYAVSPTPTVDSSGEVAGFADATGVFLPLVCTLNATRVTDTIARWLGTDAAGLSELAEAADYRSTSAVLVPYFSGERTPNLPNATGSIYGLRTDTTREELALAAHDGVLCSQFQGLESLRKAGVEVDGTLYLIGGGARSATYRQRCADLWGRPIVVPDADETVATGAAVQAAVIASDDSFSEVQKRWVLGQGVTVEPRDDADGAATLERYRTHATRVADFEQTNSEG